MKKILQCGECGTTTSHVPDEEAIYCEKHKMELCQTCYLNKHETCDDQINIPLTLHNFIVDNLKAKDLGGGDFTINNSNAFHTKYKLDNITFSIYYQTEHDNRICPEANREYCPECKEFHLFPKETHLNELGCNLGGDITGNCKDCVYNTEYKYDKKLKLCVRKK